MRDGGIAHDENSRNLGKKHDQPAFHTAPREMKLPAGCFGAKYDDRSSLSNEMLGGVLQKVAKIDVSATVRMHASHAIFFAKPFRRGVWVAALPRYAFVFPYSRRAGEFLVCVDFPGHVIYTPRQFFRTRS